jgi:autotransporter-associated beta strand protein
VDNGTVAFARTDTVSYGGAISGAGGVNLSSGTLILSSTQSYSGVTSVAAASEIVLSAGGSIATSSDVADNGTLDLSATTTPQLASLGGNGTVLLGGQTLTLTKGIDNFSGSIAGTGGLTLTGGSQTLSGGNLYTGATTINGGTLTVTGSILNSAGVTVNSGGILAGSGAVPAVTLSSGGAIEAGAAGSGTLSVNGSITYASGANTIVSVTSAGAGKISVSGAESLAGTLSVASADGTFPVGEKLTVLTAGGGISGNFSSQSFTSNGVEFMPALSYDTDDVYLQVNLIKLSPLLPAGVTRNQQNSVAGIDAAAAGDTLPSVFGSLGNLSSAALASDASAFSSQIGADAAQAGRSLFDPFVDAIFDHVAQLQSTGAPRPRIAAPDSDVWATGFTGAAVTAGEPDSFGTDKFRSSVAGFALGGDWDLSRIFRLGGALAAGSSNFHVSAAQSTGHVNAIQGAGYGLLQLGTRLYASFAGALALDNVSTDRLVTTTTESDALRGKMSGLMFGGRLESGVELGWIIPYVALNDDMFHAPAYSETALSGSPNFALSFLSQNTNDPAVEAGFRQRAETGTARWRLAFTDQLAWVHNMSPVPAASAGYAALSGSAFTSFGARLPTNAGLFDLGVAVQNRDGFGVGLNFRSLLATDQQSYTAMGSLTYSW